MPELPEVETIVRTLRPRLLGRRITGFTTRWRRTCLPSPALIRAGVVDRTIDRISRRGKFIVITLADGGHLLIHLRMSGRLEWDDTLATGRTHIRATWDLDDESRLVFVDARKFGRVHYTCDPAAVLGVLGPEPLSRAFTATRLAALLAGRRRQLKPLLLDQTIIAGLGNIYTDEALFAAGLHPLTRAADLDRRQVQRLHQAIRDVLRLAIRKHGTSIDWIYPGGWMQRHLKVYGRTAQPCRHCGTPIRALRVGQRGTHLCPVCQPEPVRPRTQVRHTRRSQRLA